MTRIPSAKNAAVVALAIFGVASASFAADATKPNVTKPNATKTEPKPEYMFVQTSDDLKTEKNTLRLVNVSPQTLYFTDRPVRQAGHVSTSEYMEEWTSKAGKDNFKANPPNATLSVYESGSKTNTLTVVELTNPKVDGKDMVYQYKVIEGTMPKGGGATALFIDWIGPGGGVGPGFHGVGVGARGVGVR
jgi:hypothetical protein